MKQAQNARKQRGRSAPRKGGKNNGPGNRNNEPKVRGNPKQLLEKYKTQAREARQAGDRVQAEYFYQFADHYQRVLNEITVRNGGNPSQDGDQNDSEDSEGEDNGQQRRGRGRRQRGNGPESRSDNRNDNGNVRGGDNQEEAEKPTDPVQADQPMEVHPELDLDGTTASVEDGEKPKRRRAPAQRRRAPRAKPTDEAPSPPVDTKPEGNEAA